MLAGDAVEFTTSETVKKKTMWNTEPSQSGYDCTCPDDRGEPGAHHLKCCLMYREAEEICVSSDN